MKYSILLILFSFLLLSCNKGLNKGVTNKRDFNSGKPPSVRIKEEYDDIAKKYNKGQRKIDRKRGRNLEKALDKQKFKKLKRDKRYLKRKKRQGKKKD